MSLIWGFLKPEDLSGWLRETAAAGYDGVTGFEADFARFEDDPRELADMLKACNLSLAAVDWRMKDDEREYRRHFELMRTLDCRLFVCIDAPEDTKDYARYGRLLNRVGKAGAEYGISVHYHNHTAAVGETMTDMERLLAETDPALVKVMLDLGHATKDFVELPPAERAITFLERYWDRVHYMEFKDWNLRTDLNTPLGEGLADYARVFQLMKERGWSGWITVEQNGNDGPSLGRTPSQCAQASRAFIRKGLGI
jgi:sugar phosphate isomerase/epimerase